MPLRRRHVWQRLNDLSYRTKLLLTYTLIATIPLAILSWKNYYASTEFVSEFARENLYSIVRQNNEILDAELSRAEESSLAMIGEQVLFEQYLQANPRDEYSMINMEKKVSRVLNKYFPEMDQMFSIHLMTRYSNIGSTGSSNLIPYENFHQTPLYRAALQADGGMAWFPTFSYERMFQREISQANPPEHARLLAGVRLMKLFKINNSEVIELNEKVEPPILVITYRPEIYRSRFTRTLPSTGASFFIFTPEGRLVSGTDQVREGALAKPEWLDKAVKMRSGTLSVMQDGKPQIVCFDTSEVTGWISAVTISPDALGAAFLPEIKSTTFNLTLLLLMISLLLAFIFSSSITRPIHQLLRAIKKTGEGEFDTRVPVDSYNEMGLLIHKFNQMNKKVSHLIEENYKVKLREKEMQMMALNIQLNPHFLYNTLNIMNWTALENNQKELSRMIVSLSSMLQYTTENRQDIGDLKEDMNWLRHYIFITEQRFEDKFRVTFDIAPELYDYKVPKLFLQPFVENAIVHGFARLHSGGRIVIRGRLEGEARIFTVEDNGIGIPESRLAEIRKTEGESVGIRNVDQRIKLIYGDGYGVSLHSVEGEGTLVNIKLPLANA
ncbi:HAMP domain-containing protein [Paenibacillus faecis]|uniref:histidine kinase n=1 Tax=Paenibacillus faecis TaxID=862114 RepID=A0A5D0CJQ5_9BACL|nr:HAMP domain-containing protein [Paenibacillus faecis]